MLCNHWYHVRLSGLSSGVFPASFVTVRVLEKSPFESEKNILFPGGDRQRP